MSMMRRDGIVLDSDGVPVPGAAVTIRVKATGNVATTYSDETGTAKTNPLTTDTYGRYWYYAADGDYREILSNGFELADVTLYSGIAREARVTKAATETVNNSSALQADDELLFAVGFSETWEFEIIAMVTSAAAAGLKWDIDQPAGGTTSYKWSELWDGTTLRAQGVDALSTDTVYAGGVAALSSDTLVIRGLVINGATSGNVSLRWAQHTADVSDTQILLGSMLMARRIA